MNYDDRSPGWACVDCLVLLAHGEVPAYMTDDDLGTWQAGVNKTFDKYHVTIGHATEDHEGYDCPKQGGWDEYEQFTGTYTVAADPDAECDCETIPFGTMGCDVCGSGLGGEMNGVTFWPNPRG
jgi:hypothetical protein